MEGAVVFCFEGTQPALASEREVARIAFQVTATERCSIREVPGPSSQRRRFQTFCYFRPCRFVKTVKLTGRHTATVTTWFLRSPV